MANLSIRRAQAEDVALVAPLFHAYRSFYQRDGDQERAHNFIASRLQQQDSVLFLAVNDAGEALGFTQLFPTFSSVSAKAGWILNDLYVLASARGQGVARALLHQAIDHGKASGAAWLTLQTARDNLQAQALYRSMGFQLDEKYLSFQYVFG